MKQLSSMLYSFRCVYNNIPTILGPVHLFPLVTIDLGLLEWSGAPPLCC